MLEYSRKEKTRALTEKWKDLEVRLARVRAEEERRRQASGNQERPKKKMVWTLNWSLLIRTLHS